VIPDPDAWRMDAVQQNGSLAIMIVVVAVAIMGAWLVVRDLENDRLERVLMWEFAAVQGEIIDMSHHYFIGRDSHLVAAPDLRAGAAARRSHRRSA
jgi:hypothetical protein